MVSSTASPVTPRHQRPWRVVVRLGRVCRGLSPLKLSILTIMMVMVVQCGAAAAVNQTYTVTTLHTFPSEGLCTLVMESITEGTVLYTSAYNNTLNRLYASGTSEVVAGTFTTTGGNNDGIGTSARFSQPRGLTAPGADGIIFIADSGNHRIRRVGIATMNVTTLAGSGIPGSTNGIGSNASFRLPTAIVRCNGTLYVSEYSGPYIRKINVTSAEVSNMVERWFATYYGLSVRYNGIVGGPEAYNAQESQVLRFAYQLDPNVVVQYDSSTPPAQFRGISVIDVAPFTTSLFVADYGRHVILQRNLSSSNGSTTVFAGSGTGTAEFEHPNSVFAYTDGNGNTAVLVADRRTIRRIAVVVPTSTMTLTKAHTSSHSLTDSRSLTVVASRGAANGTASLALSPTHSALTPSSSCTATDTSTSQQRSKSNDSLSWSRSISSLTSSLRLSASHSPTPSASPSRTHTGSQSSPSATASVVKITTTESCARALRVDPVAATDAAADALCTLVKQNANPQNSARSNHTCLALNVTAAGGGEGVTASGVAQSNLNNSSSNSALASLVVVTPPQDVVPLFPLRIAVPFSIPADWALVVAASDVAVVDLVGGEATFASPPAPGATQWWMTTVLDAPPSPGSVTVWSLAASCGASTQLVDVSLTWPATNPETATTGVVTQATSGMVALASVGTGTDMSSAVSLAMMSLLSCSGQPPALSSTAYVISVFFDLGFVATAFGNMGIVLAAILVHLAVQTSVATSRGCGIFDDRLAFLRFPALSIVGAEFLVPGAVFGAAASLVATGAGDVAAGVCALLIVVAAIAGVQMLSLRHVLPQMTFDAYVSYPTGYPWEQTYLFPSGQWFPAALRMRYKPLMGLMKLRRWCWLRVAGDVVLAACLALVTGLTVGGLPSACVLAPVVGGLHLVFALVLVVVRPYRCPVDKVCGPLVKALFGILCILKFAEVDAAADHIQVALSVVQLWKALMAFWVSRREAQWVGSAASFAATEQQPSVLLKVEDECDALELVDVRDTTTYRVDGGGDEELPSSDPGGEAPHNGHQVVAGVAAGAARPRGTEGAAAAPVDDNDGRIFAMVERDGGDLDALFWDANGKALTQQRGTSSIGSPPALRGNMLAAFYES